MSWLRGFKNFLMQGDLIVIAVGLVIALAFSTLISQKPAITPGIPPMHSSPRIR